MVALPNKWLTSFKGGKEKLRFKIYNRAKFNIWLKITNNIRLWLIMFDKFSFEKYAFNLMYLKDIHIKN